MLPGLSSLRHRLRRNLYRAAGSDDYLKSGELRQTFLNTINEDLAGDAAAIKVPALLVWGATDTDTPPADGRLLAAAIPRSTLRIIPDAGHFVHLDAPDQTYEYVSEFLR
jgi:pimeloyl-ACP methyl ester carboxylesterase